MFINCRVNHCCKPVDADGSHIPNGSCTTQDIEDNVRFVQIRGIITPVFIDVHPEWNIDAPDQNVRHCQRDDVVIGQNPEAFVGGECCTHKPVPENGEDCDDKIKYQRCIKRSIFCWIDAVGAVR